METDDDLLQRFNMAKSSFSSRVNVLAEEYDNLLEHVPGDLDECCSIEVMPEPGVLHLTLIFEEDVELPPIVKQRIKEIFHELFPEGLFQ